MCQFDGLERKIHTALIGFHARLTKYLAVVNRPVATGTFLELKILNWKKGEDYNDSFEMPSTNVSFVRSRIGCLVGMLSGIEAHLGSGASRARPGRVGVRHGSTAR
jgi:hypothetical protein